MMVVQANIQSNHQKRLPFLAKAGHMDASSYVTLDSESNLTDWIIEELNAPMDDPSEDVADYHASINESLPF